MIWCFLMLQRGRSAVDVAQLINERRVVRVEVESGEMWDASHGRKKQVKMG